MKKFIVLLVVLGLVSVANAAVVDVLITSLDGLAITPTKEITILPSQMVDFQITFFNVDNTRLLFGLNSFINISGPGALNYEAFVPWTRVWDDELGDWVYTNVDISNSFDPTLHVLDTASNPDYILEGAKTWGIPGNNTERMAVKDLQIHCDAMGDVHVWLTNRGTGTLVIDSTLHQPQTDWSYGSGIIIHQMPEPATLMLLGLGSLFLIRRKR